jgi:hypothetical protein
MLSVYWDSVYPRPFTKGQHSCGNSVLLSRELVWPNVEFKSIPSPTVKVNTIGSSIEDGGLGRAQATKHRANIGKYRIASCNRDSLDDVCLVSNRAATVLYLWTGEIIVMLTSNQCAYSETPIT